MNSQRFTLADNWSITVILFCIQVLQNFVEKDNLAKLIREQLSGVTSNVDGLIKAIPTIIEADRILIDKLQEQRINSQVRYMYSRCRCRYQLKCESSEVKS